jgi:hypothetical protein
MTTPRVTELPRRLEPVVRDTFLAAPARAVAAHNVIALRRPDAPVALRPPAPLAAA